MKSLEGTLYKLIEDENFKEIFTVEILEGDFKGIVYAYGGLKIKEPNKDNDYCELTFDTQFVKMPPSLKQSSIVDFNKVAGSILEDLVMNVVLPDQEGS